MATIVLVFASALVEPFASLSRAQQQLKRGSLAGEVGEIDQDGHVVPAESATVYVMFAPIVFKSYMAPGPLVPVDTAGGQFSYQLNNILAKNKQLKALNKAAKQNGTPAIAFEIADYYLQAEDQALAETRDWLAKHPDRAWQMQILTPDTQGFWAVKGAPAAQYIVVARGRLNGYDVTWERGLADIPPLAITPDTTVSVPLLKPQFFRPEKYAN